MLPPLWFPLLAALAAATTLRAAEPTYDLIISGGLVYEGTGAAPVRADVAVRGDKIVRVGDLAGALAARRISANGLAVSPGFVDLHAHIEPIERMPDAESAVRQGVTTVLGGPDGNSPLPLGAFLARLEKLPLGANAAFLAGHGTIRSSVLKLVDRAPTPAELDTMKSLVAQALREGAFGLSTGLKYLPGTFAKTDEIVALAQVAASLGGIYTSHLREEGLGLIPAVTEAIAIARGARIPVVLTHHKAIGKPTWGQSVKTLALVDAARAEGLDVMVDVYPYTASHTGLSVLIPSWALAGGRDEFKQRAADSALRAKMKAEIVNAILTDRGGGDLRCVQFSAVAWKRDLEGKTLADWCAQRRLEPTPENGAELVIEGQLNGGASCIYHAMDEADVERIVRHPQAMIASDGRLSRPGEESPHPRCYGTFPRVLGRYVREKRLLTLETAINKMTGMPARRLGLADRGRIAEGLQADLVVFDPATVRDTATFEKPHQYPEGIPFVIVNGIVTVDGGRFTAARGGRVLRHAPGAGAR
ncbi:MAG: D-aminoacylase [Verrucomicrobia bacterium]|nr:D-aminoacylase [Verrucomicrobiota bacterium]